MAFEQYKYQNDYNKNHYARLNVLVSKDDKNTIEEHWKKQGYKSFNAYITELIRRDLNPENVIFDKNAVGEVVSVNLKEVKADKVTKKSGKATVKVDF